MKKCICGAGLSITGALLLFPIMLMLDWRRVREYGLFHEIDLYSTFPLIIFLLGMLFIIAGVVLMIVGTFASNDDGYVHYDEE